VPLPDGLRRRRWHHVVALVLGASIAGAGAAMLLDAVTAILL